MQILNKLNILLLLIICSNSFSCKKNCADGYEVVDFKETDITCCYYEDTSYVIYDDSTYYAQLSGSVSDLPQIDFSQYTLIAKAIDGKCDEECYKIRDVCKNDDSQTILITMDHKTGNPFKCGCKKQVGIITWLLIPKINSVYSIQIQVK